MSSPPTFTVIIAAYNAAATIAQTLESCCRQTFPPHQIIVVNDGSTDNTAEMVKEHFGAQVQLISLVQNKGPAAARNRGMAAATGSHWAFLDADDTWHPQKLARMAVALQAHPKAALVFHNYKVGFPKSYLPAEILPLQKVFRGAMLLRNLVATPCAVVRAGQLRFDKRMHYLEDWDFFLRCFEKGPVYHLPQTLTFLGRAVLSAGGQSSNRWAMRKGELRGYTKFAMAHKGYLPLLPALWALSLCKHAVGFFRRQRG